MDYTYPAPYFPYPPTAESPPDLPLYAPVPLVGRSALPFVVPDSASPQHSLDYYTDMPLQPTFPTPSELLVEMDTDAPPSTNQPKTASNRAKSSTDPCAPSSESSLNVVPTDSISYHEKKRHYLECIEHYILYLHQQLNLVGAEPVPLVRVPKYRGLSSRSIRTLLVHMENNSKKLNLRTLSGEQRFIALRDAVSRQDAAMQQRQSQGSNADYGTDGFSFGWQQ